jgi:hypothetical protein
VICNPRNFATPTARADSCKKKRWFLSQDTQHYNEENNLEKTKILWSHEPDKIVEKKNLMGSHL